MVPVASKILEAPVEIGHANVLALARWRLRAFLAKGAGFQQLGRIVREKSCSVNDLWLLLCSQSMLQHVVTGAFRHHASYYAVPVARSCVSRHAIARNARIKDTTTANRERSRRSPAKAAQVVLCRPRWCVSARAWCGSCNNSNDSRTTLQVLWRQK